MLRDGECAIHGAQEGNKDLRLRMVLDNGKSTISLIVNKEASESLTGMTQEEISSYITENGSMQFVQELRERLLGRELVARGRTIVDEQGAMLLSDDTQLIEADSVLAKLPNFVQVGGWFDCNLLEELEGNRLGICWHQNLLIQH